MTVASEQAWGSPSWLGLNAEMPGHVLQVRAEEQDYDDDVVKLPLIQASNKSADILLNKIIASSPSLRVSPLAWKPALAS